MTDLSALAAEIAELRNRLQALEDKDAIVRLQYQYGYYIDNRMWDAMVGLFCDDASEGGGPEIEIGQRGAYVGKERIHRFLEQGLGGGRWGLLKDEIIHHIQLQPLVTVAADGLTAQCRARAQVQGNSPPGSGKFLLAEGLYENSYVKQADGWRIKRLWWVPTYYFQIAGFDQAVFDSGPPSQDFPPDRPSVPVNQALGRRFPPFHYAHPASGEAFADPASKPDQR